MQRIKGGKNDVTNPHVDTLIPILARGSSSRLDQMRHVEKLTCRLCISPITRKKKDNPALHSRKHFPLEETKPLWTPSVKWWIQPNDFLPTCCKINKTKQATVPSARTIQEQEKRNHMTSNMSFSCSYSRSKSYKCSLVYVVMITRTFS